ncbi:hypothetical protein L6164_037588 [Bauhinia variegata]|uniref:Uncharacterized protein n=1 Tax=Bauhinia variegata TaxID=167791 RepID=A0ACB9KKL0_BAUVA|nr:hypothetical protein L6164_037588 [Bauhinia variegata]
MEVSLSANHQGLRSTSCSSLSFSSFSLCNLHSIRIRFLGCSHNLRPPVALRSRKKCSKLGLLRVHSPRFIFKASLDSQSIIVIVIIFTLSAVSLLYYRHSRRKKNTKEIPGRPKFALSQGSNVGNQAIQTNILGFQRFQIENSLEEIGLLKESTGELNHAFEDKEAQMLFWRSTVVHEEAVMTKTSESSSDFLVSSVNNGSSSNNSEVLEQSSESSPDFLVSSVNGSSSNNSELVHEETVMTKTSETSSDFLVSSVNNGSSSNNSEAVKQSFLPVAYQSSSLEPITSVEEITELHVGRSQDESDSNSELLIIMDESKPPAASVDVENALKTVDEHAKEKSELDAISNDVLFGESAREELYMFYEANKSSNGSMLPLSSLKSFSPHTSFLKRNKLSSTIGNTILKGSELSTEKSAEYVEGIAPIASYKEDHPPVNRSKYLDKGGRALGDGERNHPVQKYDKILPQIEQSTRAHVDQKNYRSQHVNTYNRLLKDGRLHECVELLKDMEIKGVLDMSKVHHAKFFNICKRQKAVREAFDYTKLIPNPKLSTFNMLMTVCASSQDSEGAFQVLHLVQGAGLKPDCKLYTTLISTCAKSGKVDRMFEVYHEMVNSGVEPNVHTYGALIDGCARAGQVAKAFGAYGIMRSKKVQPDRVVFNALIAACAQSGAVDRAFDVLAEMAAETHPIDPDNITLGALMKACAKAGQVERARDVYKMLQKYNIKGTPEVYTIAINSCSQTGDWEFACSVYRDMTGKGVLPDEMFLSALIDVAGHARKLDSAFEVLQEARDQGIRIGIMSYSSLMGACSNARNWQKALELYEDLKSLQLVQTVSVVNALITALCEGDQFQKAMEVLSEMKELGLCPNGITYSILIVASEKKDDLEAGQMLLSQAKKDGVVPNLTMCRCIIGMCLRRFERASFVGEPVLSFNSGRPQVDNKWTSLALMVYRETIRAGERPTSEILSQVLGCLQLPHDTSLKSRLIENLGVSVDTSRSSNLYSLIDGFGAYDSRALSLLEEAASIGIVPSVSFKVNPIVLDIKEMPAFTAEVYLLTVFKGLKHRLAAGARLPNIIILLPVETAKISSPEKEKVINLAGRAGQAVATLLRRLRIPYQGNESNGKIRINGVVLKRWFQPKLASPFSGKPDYLGSSQSRLGKGINRQQQNIRTDNLSLF